MISDSIRLRQTVSPTELLLLLTAVNIFSVMDRMIFSICAPLIAIDLQLSNTELGALSGIFFSAFYALFGLPLARLADRRSKPLVITLSLAVWSGITVVTGAVQTFLQIALARIGVAIGEAGATPASHAMLSETFSTEQRPFVMAIHSAGAPVGAALGLSLGGILSEALGWRWAFIVLGLPGALLAFLVWIRIGKETSPRAKTTKDSNFKYDLGKLFAPPAYCWLIAGFAVGAFITNGIIQWLPTYFVRALGASTAEVGMAFGTAYGGGACLGMIAGGILGSRLVAIDRRWAVWIAGLSYIAAMPCGFMALRAEDTQTAYVLVFLMSAAVSSAYGPAYAMVQDLAPVGLRALSSAVAVLFATLVGAGTGPLVIGIISDILPSTGVEALRQSMSLALLLSPVVALLYLASSMTINSPPSVPD